jgi:uncharacterized protein (TIGR04255 family)
VPRTKFKNPPINELIVGLYFNGEAPGLRAEHIGAFWASVRKDFPNVQQQVQIMHPALATAVALAPVAFEFTTVGEALPMPRFWLESTEPAYLMQLQKDAFLFNWRRKDKDYPHFDAVKDGFDANFARFADFLQSEFQITLPPIAVAELTYSNLVEKCEYWSSPRDTKNVLPHFSIASPDTTSDPADFTQVAVQRFEKDLSVRTTIRNANTPKGPCLVFELRCTGPQGNVTKSATDAWFNRAHDLVGKCFLDMTVNRLPNLTPGWSAPLMVDSFRRPF